MTKVGSMFVVGFNLRRGIHVDRGRGKTIPPPVVRGIGFGWPRSSFQKIENPSKLVALPSDDREHPGEAPSA